MALLGAADHRLKCSANHLPYVKETVVVKIMVKILFQVILCYSIKTVVNMKTRILVDTITWRTFIQKKLDCEKKETVCAYVHCGGFAAALQMLVGMMVPKRRIRYHKHIRIEGQLKLGTPFHQLGPD